MKKAFYTFLAIFFTLFLIVTPVLAQSFRSDTQVTIGKNETINGDFFGSGKRIIISGTVNGDTYVAGGNIDVEGIITGDLLVVGGNVNITGQVNGNVRSAGGTITISGNVGKNITALGGTILINENAQVKGSLVAAGGNIQVSAPLGKGVSAFGGNLIVRNTVGDNALFSGGNLTLAQNAKISGNLTYFSRNEANIEQGASISGTISHQLPPNNTSRQNIVKGFLAAKSAFSLIGFISSLLVGLFFVWLFPRFFQGTAVIVEAKPWQSLGIGLLTLIVTPIVAIFIFITIIGIPIALMLFALYFIVIYFSHLVTALFLGIWILKTVNQKANLYWTFVAGQVLLTIFTFIPFLGGIVSILSLLFGLGALEISKYGLYRAFRTKKLI